MSMNYADSHRPQISVEPSVLERWISSAPDSIFALQEIIANEEINEKVRFEAAVHTGHLTACIEVTDGNPHPDFDSLAAQALVDEVNAFLQ